MISSKNILYHELVGTKIKILESSQNNLINLFGEIIFETKNMLHIRINNNLKLIPKTLINKSILFIPLGVCFINGKSLIGRPEDRILKIKGRL
ncbi:MAG: ribonuclease P protein component 1 [Nitrososphaeraceae archaeon]